MEKGISEEYLQNLNELYENKLLVELQKPETKARVLIYDVNEMTPEEIAQSVQKDVENLLQNMSNRKDSQNFETNNNEEIIEVYQE